MSAPLRASCSCTSVPIIRLGLVVCAACGAAVVSEASTVEGYTSLRLPPDAKNVEAFNRACRGGRVKGASKRGRVWSCTREAWQGRAAAPAPRHRSIPARPATAKAKTSPAVGDELLSELGLVRAGG